MEHPDPRNVYRDSAWRHFVIHADQRLKMFQFYITISTALIGGGVLLIRTDHNAIGLVLLGFLASFFSFVFWKLEVRTRNLVKNAEDAIKHLDESSEVPDLDGEPSPLKLFTRDDFRAKRTKQRSIPSHFSYHRCFVWVFAVIGFLGTVGMIYGIAEILCANSTAVLPPTVLGLDRTSFA